MGAPGNGDSGDESASGTKRPAMASLRTAMPPMAEAIGGMVARQQKEWDEHQRLVAAGAAGKGSNRGIWLDISPKTAVPIPDVPRPRRIAYVDGGNATLLGSPGWSVGFNRVAYAVCQGSTVHQPRHVPRVDFLSLLVAESNDDSDENGADGPLPHLSRRYALRTFPVGDGENGNSGNGRPPRLDSQSIPTDADMGNFDGGDGNEDDSPPDTRRPTLAAPQRTTTGPA